MTRPRLDTPRLRRKPTGRRGWDLTALLNAADPRASLPERHLWLVRLVEWLRHPARTREELSGDAAEPVSEVTLLPLRRLKHLLNVLDRNPEPRADVVGLLRAFRSEIDLAALLADFGFAQRVAVFSATGCSSTVTVPSLIQTMPSCTVTCNCMERLASAASAWLAAASICHTVRLLSRASLSAIAFHHTGVDAA